MAYKELVAYIQDAKAKGFSDEEIKTKLASTGWTAGSIEDAFKEVSMSVPGKPALPNSGGTEVVAGMAEEKPKVPAVKAEAPGQQASGMPESTLAPTKPLLEKRSDVPPAKASATTATSPAGKSRAAENKNLDVFPESLKAAAVSVVPVESSVSAQEKISSPEAGGGGTFVSGPPALTPTISTKEVQSASAAPSARSVFAANVMPGKKVAGKGRKLALVLVLVIFLLAAVAGGAWAAAYFGYVKLPLVQPSPDVVWERFSSAGKLGGDGDTITADVSLSLRYEDQKESLNPAIASEFSELGPISNLAAEVKINGVVTVLSSEDVEADIDTEASLENAGSKLSIGIPFILKDKYVYFDLDASPMLKEIFSAPGVDSGWIKISMSPEDLAALQNEVDDFAETDIEVENVFKDIDLNKLEVYVKEHPFFAQAEFVGEKQQDSQLVYSYTLSYNKENVKGFVGMYMDEIAKLPDLKDYGDVVNSVRRFMTDVVDRTNMSPVKVEVGAYNYELYGLSIEGDVLSLVSVVNSIYSMFESYADNNLAEAKKVSDVQQISFALEMYKQQYGGYPAGAGGEALGLAPDYMPAWPAAPAATGTCSDWDNTYWYEHKGEPINNTTNPAIYPDFDFTFCLEKPTSGFVAGNGRLTPSEGITVAGKPACAAAECQADLGSELTKAFDSFYQSLEYNAKFAMKMSISNFSKERKVKAPEQARDITEFLNQESSSLPDSTSTPEGEQVQGQILSQVRSMLSTLELYYNDNGVYPESLDVLVPDYIDVVDTLPYPNTGVCVMQSGGPDKAWEYQSDGNQAYSIQFCLPAEVGGYSSGWHVATPAGIQ